MARVLSVDASADVLAVSLSNGSRHVVWQGQGGAHASAQVLGVIDTLLKVGGVTLAELDAIAFAQGPGAFTGLRLACAVVQGLAWTADKPVLPLCSLAVVAWAGTAMSNTQGTSPWADTDSCAVWMDARMGEVYARNFQWKFGENATGYWQPVANAQVLAPQQLLVQTQAQLGAAPGCMHVVGNAVQAYPALASDLSMQAPTQALQMNVVWNDVPCETPLICSWSHSTLHAPVHGCDHVENPPWRALGLAALAESQCHLALSGQEAFVLAHQALPLYVRDQVAQTTAQREAAKQQAQSLAVSDPVQPKPAVRLAGLYDLDAIEAVQAAAYAATPWHTPWSRKQFSQALQAGQKIWLWVPDSSQPKQAAAYIVGLMGVDEAEVLGLAVDPRFQRQGIAVALLNAVAAWAKQGLAQRVVLEVRGSNQAAQACYRAQGFEPIGQRRAYYQNPPDDACVMAWPIASELTQTP